MEGEADPDIPTTATAMPVGEQAKQSGFQSSPMVPFVPALANDREQTTQVGCIYLLSSYIVFHMHLSLNMCYVPLDTNGEKTKQQQIFFFEKKQLNMS